MYIFGICGRSGSGKSTACGFLREKGFYCINADEVCHRLYETNGDCIKELAEAFGNSVVKDGKIDRSVLRVVVFEKDNGIEILNRITHKYIIRSIMEEAHAAFKRGKRYVVIDAPVLFESGLDEHCDAVIALVSKEEYLLDRLEKRDGLPRQALRKRLMAQKSNGELWNHETRILVNRGTLLELRQKIYLAIMLELMKISVIKPAKEVKRYGLKKA